MAGTWLPGDRVRDDRQGPPGAVLIAVAPREDETSLGELERLADTDGLVVVDTIVQHR